ncbi:MAG: FimV/HubP family polar landmark protein [Methylococcaceae bacterium]
MRNLTKTLAVVSLLAPASAYPLGIGDIKLHSALNQNLDAEISLILSAGEKISDVKVSLASPEKFIQAGVPWASFLSKIKFQTVVGSNGSAVIKLSSREALKEPFLDLMLEVSWPKGNLYREFTVLVDPPAVYQQPTIPVSTSAEDYQYKRSVVSDRPLVSRPQPSAYAGNGYATTGRNDTLWDIAQRVNTDSDVSIEQMMIAIYEENPRAFYKDNVNALLAGRKLKIPDRESALKLSRKQALAEFNRQVSEWKNRSAVPVETVVNNEAATDNQLTLHAPTESAVGDNIDITSADKQVTAKKTVDDVSVSSTGADKQAQSSKREGAGEESATTAPVDDAIQTKIAELEKQLAVMQKIIALKDQQLATLQNKPQEQSVAPEKTEQPLPADNLANKQTPKPETEPKQQPVKPQNITDKVVKPEVRSTDSSSNYYLGVAGVGTGLLTVLGWLWLRSRRLDDGANFERAAAFSGTSASQSASDDFSDSTNQDDYGYDKVTASDNLFLADFMPGDFDAFEMEHDEIDPISEADVYLAYGRYQQAEDLMKDAIQDQPTRDECKLKLLEVFYSSKNPKAFEKYATELANTGKRDDIAFWTKVVEMGSEICPDSMLFAAGLHQFDAPDDSIIENDKKTESADAKLAEIVEDVDFDLSSFDDMFHSQAVQETSQATNDLFGFDVSSFEEEADEADKADNRSIDFDFSLNEFGADSTVKNVLDESQSRIDLSKDKPSDLNGNLINYTFEDDADFDFGLQIDESDESSAEKHNFADLTKMDEMETKLDLAIAYVDMSDKDAARDIAQEVLEKGTAKQKMIAQSLLDDLG